MDGRQTYFVCSADDRDRAWSCGFCVIHNHHTLDSASDSPFGRPNICICGGGVWWCNMCGWRTNMSGHKHPLHRSVGYHSQEYWIYHQTHVYIGTHNVDSRCKSVYMRWRRVVKDHQGQAVIPTRFPLIRTIAQTNMQTQTLSEDKDTICMLHIQIGWRVGGAGGHVSFE